MSKLTFFVRVSPSVREHGTEPVPGGYPAISSPISTTLILGDRDAVLVDPPWHVDAVMETIDWIKSLNCRLTRIYITHGHGDHWFGSSSINSSFPDSEVCATTKTIEYMYRYSRHRNQLWDERFPGQVADGPVVVRSTDLNPLVLEGSELQVLPLGHTDTNDSTALWVPEINLLVAGDAVYNYCHPALNEVSNGGAQSWLAALDTLAALDAHHVVAGHRPPGAGDDPGAIQRTKTYILDFMSLLDAGNTPMELFNAMLHRYPDYTNPKALWRSICAVRKP